MKNITFFILALLLASNANAQSVSCKVLLKNISEAYSGKCLNGLANGKGRATGLDTYIGVFKDGLPHGKGKYIFKNGDTFNGYWKNGKKEGKGKFKYSIDGEKYTLKGYWVADEYVGLNSPVIPYLVRHTAGIVDHKVEKKASLSQSDNKVTFIIKSSFLDFSPKDLYIEMSSGHISQVGKKIEINQYLSPLFCEITYTIMIGRVRKQCRFFIDILEEGKYIITLYND